MVAGREGRQEKGIVCWTWGPDSSFSAQASAALGEIREDHELEWFRLEEGALGRAKEKHSGFTTIGGFAQPLIPSFISCHKLDRLNSLVGVRVSPYFLISGIINDIYTSVLSMCL